MILHAWSHFLARVLDAMSISDTLRSPHWSRNNEHEVNEELYENTVENFRKEKSIERRAITKCLFVDTQKDEPNATFFQSPPSSPNNYNVCDRCVNSLN